MNLPRWTASTKTVLASLGIGFALLGFSSLLSLRTSASPKPAQPPPAGKELTDAEMSHMSSDQLAKYVFENHGCNSCHTMGAGGKLGFTDRGKQVGKGFQGCIALLTSMNVVALVKPADRTAKEKVDAAKFSEFGCKTCHQITPGKMGLTSYGTKLKSFHMACTDVEKILGSQR